MLEYFELVLDSVGTVWVVCVIIYEKNYDLGVWVGNGHGFRFHKVEPMLGEWAAHGQPTARLETIKNSLGLLGWIGNGPCVS